MNLNENKTSNIALIEVNPNAVIIEARARNEFNGIGTNKSILHSKGQLPDSKQIHFKNVLNQEYLRLEVC